MSTSPPIAIYVEIKQSIANEESGVVEAIVRDLVFRTEVPPTGEMARDVLRLLLASPHGPRVALELALRRSRGQEFGTPSFARTVFGGLRDTYVGELRPPTIDSPGRIGRDQILEWLAGLEIQSPPKVPAASSRQKGPEEASGHDAPDDSIEKLLSLRCKVLVCVLATMPTVRETGITEFVYGCLSEVDARGPKAWLGWALGFLRKIALTPKASVPASQAFLGAAALFDRQAGVLAEEAARACAEVEFVNRRAERLEDERDGLRSELGTAKETVVELEALRARLSAEIEETRSEIDRVRADKEQSEETWSRHTKRAGQRSAGRLRESLTHEVSEALRALDRESPNVKMALMRIRRIHDIVQDEGERT